MHPTISALLLTLCPTPLDQLAAETDLAAEPGTPGILTPSARSRAAILTAMLRVGAVDSGVEGQWFGPAHQWQSELDYARRMVATVATCPPLSADTLPRPEWYRWHAIRYGLDAATWRDRAREYRDRSEWEDDRREALLEWAAWMEREADRLVAEACRCEWMAGGNWARPRRVVLAAAGK